MSAVKSVDLLVVGNLAEDVIFGTSHYGGSAGNIAVNASRFGVDAAVLSNYGGDEFSGQYVRFLEQTGVYTGLLQQNLRVMAQCIVRSGANHSSSLEWLDNGTTEAIDRYVPSAEQAAVIRASKFIHLATTPSTLAKRIVNLKGPSTVIGYEPGPMIHTDSRFFDAEVFALSDFLFLNEEERGKVEQDIGIDNLRAIMTKNQRIIITLGKNGCSVVSKSHIEYCPIERPVAETDVVDSNGAGDAFRSGFYAELLRTGNLQSAIQLGNRLSALVIQQEGAILIQDNVQELAGHRHS